VKFILNGLRWKKKKTNAPITPTRLLPGDSSNLVVINTAATRGGEEIHSTGGGGTGPEGGLPLLKKIQKKKKSRNPQESLKVSIHSPLILAGILMRSRERGVLLKCRFRLRLGTEKGFLLPQYRFHLRSGAGL